MADRQTSGATTMRQTSRSAAPHVFQALKDAAGPSPARKPALFVEISGETWAPPFDQVVRSDPGDRNVVAIKKTTSVCEEKCDWVERMVKRATRDGGTTYVFLVWRATPRV